MPFALVPQLVAAHFLRRLISQKHELIESMATFDVGKAECREEFDRKFVMTAPWHLAGMIDVANCQGLVSGRNLVLLTYMWLPQILHDTNSSSRVSVINSTKHIK